MEKHCGKTVRLVDFCLKTMMKVGIAAAVLPLVFAALRTHDHYGYVRSDAQVIRTFKQCEISAQAAREIGKRARWWECKSAKSLQRAFPTVDLGISKTAFVEFWFALPGGRKQTASRPLTMLEFQKPEPGRIVPIAYAPQDPQQVKSLLTLADLAVLAAVGLAGLMMAGLAWRLQFYRRQIAAALFLWVRKSLRGSKPDGIDLGDDPVQVRSNGRGLGVG